MSLLGVSCDSCLKGNFRGRRYKCLVCYDYDLCATCYESGATNTRHTVDHPMQCILTRAYFELYYGGEALTNVEQPQSYVCPYCGRMGFTEATLLEHVTAEHFEPSFEVVSERNKASNLSVSRRSNALSVCVTVPVSEHIFRCVRFVPPSQEEIPT